MKDSTDQQLLGDYAGRQSEAAFAVIVARYVDLVYSAALRLVGDTHAAKDVTQGVFVALAQHAGQLTHRPTLAGWLHETARNLAVKSIRSEVRRRGREQEAALMNELLSPHPDANWEHVAPHLDAALGELEATDRDAVLLRYFKNQDLRTVGATLGISDDAAQKRVSRAVERLRDIFAKRGVSVGAGGLAVVLSANAVQAAPVGLALTISSAAVLAGTALTATITTQTTAMTMNWLNLKSITAALATALAAGTGTYLVQQHTADQLRAENQKLVAATQALTTERDQALATASEKAAEGLRRDSEKDELLRLRGEVGRLRKLAKESAQLAEQNRALQNALAQASQNTPQPEPEVDPERRWAMDRLTESKQLCLGLIMYADDHQNVFPTDLHSISNYLGNAASEPLQNNTFELVLQGAITNVASPATTIAVRSQSPFVLNGKSVKVYGFADGHAEIKREPEEGFAAWEKVHILPTPTGP